MASIGGYAFRDCTSLTSVTIPEGVESIGSFAFRNCDAITSLEIPSSITYIGGYAFAGCPVTCDIRFAKTTAEVSAMENYPWALYTGTIIHCTDGDLTVR